jgi:glycosyltransferase involved in cell wall biosynthesis
MKIGSGTCIKVLESLACGIPVISTDQGFRGIPAGARTIKNGMLEFCDAGSLIAAIQLIIAQEGGVSQDSRAYVAQHYSQDKVNSILASELLNSRPEDI